MYSVVNIASIANPTVSVYVNAVFIYCLQFSKSFFPKASPRYLSKPISRPRLTTGFIVPLKAVIATTYPTTSGFVNLDASIQNRNPHTLFTTDAKYLQNAARITYSRP